MELGLSLGDASKPFRFMEKSNHNNQVIVNNNKKNSNLGFCMALSIGSGGGGKSEKQQDKEDKEKTINDSSDGTEDGEDDERERVVVSLDHHPPRVQLNLLPLAPVPLNHLSPPPQPHSSPWPLSNNGQIGLMTRGFDVNRLPAGSTVSEDAEEAGAALSSSPSRNSGASSFQMDLCMYSGGGAGGGGGGSGNKRDSNELVGEGENGERASSRASDDDENGSTRKKLRLSKDQSVFLEESFKEHNTLNPKQKLALAKQLNLRPRQVEVWFQNRRARTKLKQTEVDCEYLKRCCETLTDENRRLQKELQELRALKSSNSNPFYMQLPATTLTMCPSCERVATTTTTATATTTTTTTATAANNNNTNNPPTTNSNSKQTPFSLSRPSFYPFSHSSQQQQSTHNIHHPANQSKAS